MCEEKREGMLGHTVQRTLSSYFLPKHNMQGHGSVRIGKPCELEAMRKQSGHFQILAGPSLEASSRSILIKYIILYPHPIYYSFVC